jgi:signal transduction histidine kinase
MNSDGNPPVMGAGPPVRPDEEQCVQEAAARTQHLAEVAVSLTEIAHYVKNVILAARIAESFLDQDLHRGASPKRVLTNWAIIKRANQKIHKLVDDMLNYSRVREPEPETLDINELISRVSEDLRYHAEKHRVTVAMDLDYGLPPVCLDPSMMYDVIFNLLSNAIDAIPADVPGQVVLRSRRVRQRRGLRIEVKDNGTGIPPAVQAKLFTLFFSTKGERGTGIGLAASRKAVERQGGVLRYRTREGRGTCFVADLPLSSGGEIARRAAGPPRRGEPRSNAPLIVG